MVVCGSDVGGKRAESVEGSLLARLDLAVHVLGNLLHGHVSGTFYQHLYVVFPCLGAKLAEHVQLQELSAVVGVVYGAGTHAVAE